MKKYHPILALILCSLLIVTLPVNALELDDVTSNYNAYQLDIYEKAVSLKTLGLFKGVSDTDYALERVPTRAETIVMLVRLLGKEDAAIAGRFKHPFDDVPEWADKYVGYAYENKLTNGMSATYFGADEQASQAMYLTFVLRALGYSDKNGRDFTWDAPQELALDIGLIEITLESGFLRSDIVDISYKALFTNQYLSADKLIKKLYSQGAVSYYGIAALDLEDKGKVSPKAFKSVTVDTAEGFLNAIDNNTYIKIDKKKIDLNDVNWDDVNNAKVKYIDLSDGTTDDKRKEIVIEAVENLIITSKDDSNVTLVTSGKTVKAFGAFGSYNVLLKRIKITSQEDSFPYSHGIIFRECVYAGISMSTINGVHGTAYADNGCFNTGIFYTEIKNADVSGVSLNKGNGFTMLESSISECGYKNSLNMDKTINAQIIGSTIHDNTGGDTASDKQGSILDLTHNDNAKFTMCRINNNASNDAIVTLAENKNLVFDRCHFKQNNAPVFMRYNTRNLHDKADGKIDEVLINGSVYTIDDSK